MSELMRDLEIKIERVVQERMEPMLSEMRKMCEDLKEINENLEQARKLLEKPRKISLWRRIWLKLKICWLWLRKR